MITVAVTIRLNQKQLLNAEKDKTEAIEARAEEERKRQRAEILSHSLNFISDTERWMDKKNCHESRMEPYREKRLDYEQARTLYQRDVQDRFGNKWYSFFELCEKQSVERKRCKIIAANYRSNYEDYSDIQGYGLRESNSYNRFGSYLDEEIEKLFKEEGAIQQEIDDERQRLIIGNPHYLFLELTLRQHRTT